MSDVFQQFLKQGRNSSHFVWFLAKLKTFTDVETGWTYGYQQFGDTVLIALEPLCAEGYRDADTVERFKKSFQNFKKAVEGGTYAFVGVQDDFKKILHQCGFQSMVIGREPWVKLENCLPTGNAGKGVRAARNQAIRNGLRVEQWNGAEIQRDEEKKKIILKLFKEWKSGRLIQVGGFLNSTDPLAYSEHRKYFMVYNSKEQVEGYLIATPVGGANSYFLEDLILGSHSSRGAGELLTLEALTFLKDSGFDYASLGVVSVTCIDQHCGHKLPKWTQTFLVTIPQKLNRFYNFQGLELFRKRFKPEFWGEVVIAVHNEAPQKQSDDRAWFHTLISLAKAFAPRLKPNFQWLKTTVSQPFIDHPISSLVFLASFSMFALINRFGDLPEWAVRDLGFGADFPGIQWLYRSLVSDYLYFNPVHFWAWGMALVLVLRWAENVHKLSFLLPFFLFTTVFDDLLNYWCIIYPFHSFAPEVYAELVKYKDVGGSLILVTMMGLQMVQFQRSREILFAFGSLVLLLCFAFTSLHYTHFLLNLNHVVFLSVGFIVGKMRFDYLRRKNEKASKGKTPVAKGAPQRKSSGPAKVAESSAEKDSDEDSGVNQVS